MILFNFLSLLFFFNYNNAQINSIFKTPDFNVEWINKNGSTDFKLSTTKNTTIKLPRYYAFAFSTDKLMVIIKMHSIFLFY